MTNANKGQWFATREESASAAHIPAEADQWSCQNGTSTDHDGVSRNYHSTISGMVYTTCLYFTLYEAWKLTLPL